MKPSAYLLAAVICAATQQVHADNVPPLNKNWHDMLELPTYRAYFGWPTEVNINPYVVILWNKIVFTEPQKSTAEIYQTEVLEIQFRCQTHDATVLRHLRYKADGTLISDESTSEKDARYFDVKHHANVNQHESITHKVASIDYEMTCVKGD